ncbi:IclR family transcriptional regulator domain-containing protein [Acetobacter tropicalis]|uniref:IclR family transcriptional regulator domain-containing protein n=1 Tax=Acetobacter tropicalis TaxID=104102 RepID=UPI001E46CBEC|nr:hypothetical protein [Acetobacter tropicalis]
MPKPATPFTWVSGGGVEVLYLDKIPGQRGLEMRSRIGKRMPLASTGLGKALMLDLPESEWRTLCNVALSHPATPHARFLTGVIIEPDCANLA